MKKENLSDVIARVSADFNEGRIRRWSDLIILIECGKRCRSIDEIPSKLGTWKAQHDAARDLACEFIEIPLDLFEVLLTVAGDHARLTK